MIDDVDLALDLDQPDDLLDPRVQQAVAELLGDEPPGTEPPDNGTVQPR